jgi:Protein of unknown function (DUF3768)
MGVVKGIRRSCFSSRSRERLMMRCVKSGGGRFDAFNADNDPYGEHDFGAFELDGEEVYRKIDYLERGTQFGAENPADDTRSCWIITIMLAEEY